MKCIAYIKGKNFQSWKSFHINLSTGVNAFVGESQAGKTSISQRSILWVLRNRPLSAKYFHDGAGDEGDMFVEIGLTDGTVVSLTKHVRIINGVKKIVPPKGKPAENKAIYRVNGHEYKNFGKKVPIEVVNALNLHTINIQEYLDPPFLLTAHPVEVSRTINEITKLSEGDEFVRELTSTVKTKNSLITAHKKALKTAKTNLELYEPLDEAKRLFGKLLAVERQIDIDSKSLRELTKLENQIIDLTNDIATLTPAKTSINRLLNAATKLDTQVTDLNAEVYHIASVITAIEEVKTLKQCELEPKHFQRIEFVLNELKESIAELYAINGLIALDNAATHISGFLDIAEKEYVDAFTELGKCPLCVSKITKETVKAIVEDLKA